MYPITKLSSFPQHTKKYTILCETSDCLYKSVDENHYRNYIKFQTDRTHPKLYENYYIIIIIIILP